MTINNFIPTIWSAKLLASLKKDQVFTQAGVMNRDYTGEISGQGSVVKINGIGPVTIRPYVKNMPIVAPETLSDAQTSLTIDQANYFNFEVDDIDKAQQTPKVMAGAMAQASYDLADVAEMYLADLLYDGVPAGNKIGTDSDAGAIIPSSVYGEGDVGTTAYDYLVDLSTKLSEAKCPKSGRWCVIPPWFTGLLVKDPRFTNIAASGSAEALRNGIVTRVAGFDVLESLNVPVVVSEGKSNSEIIAGHSMAASYAEQINKVEGYRPEDSFSDAVKGLHLFGAKVVRPTCLALLTARAVA
ncbi:P22 coat protein - protein 5 domain protein [Candidatus Pacearchaeota archaeon]|jgi:N4-gp56 family major capsid protein|nr:P22 coat protein - protein 5 domain protein [Candidatus Pacearchaeota archaeon]